ncbi:MAG: MBL fold metallo-hydrolase [Anaerofustis sp.]|jgi:L-ascorbate metabolism protein UlaG (beta-lactamase superfamily)
MFSRSKPELIYIANSGVCVQFKDKKVMIDGVHIKTPNPYFPTHEKTIEKMLLNKEPFHNIDLMLFTHHHTDHFDANATNEILKRNKHIQLVAPETVLNMLSASENYNPLLASQIRAVSIPKHKSMQMNLHDIPFEITHLIHDGETYQGVENYAYMFEIKNKVYLHVGDAQAAMSNFEPTNIFDKHVDVLIVPFPFIGLSAGRKIIKQIGPQRVIVVHLPNKKQDTMNWLHNTMKVYKKYHDELPPTEFLTKPGQIITL